MASVSSLQSDGKTPQYTSHGTAAARRRIVVNWLAVPVHDSPGVGVGEGVGVGGGGSGVGSGVDAGVGGAVGGSVGGGVGPGDGVSGAAVISAGVDVGAGLADVSVADAPAVVDGVRVPVAATEAGGGSVPGGALTAGSPPPPHAATLARTTDRTTRAPIERLISHPPSSAPSLPGWVSEVNPPFGREGGPIA